MSTIARAKPLLGTLVEIRTVAASEAAAVRASNAAFDAIALVHRLMSFHDANSDLGHLNRFAHERPVRINYHTYTVLRRALEFSRLSDGLFDCTIGARLVALEYLPGGLATATGSAAGYRDIELLPDLHVRYRRPLAIDLGGIAKGYAVDRAIDALADHGASAGLVNAGGDLRAFGDVRWPIAVRDPRSPGNLLPVSPIRNGALATSAAYFAGRVRNGEPIAPIVDPRTGTPRYRRASVSVLAPNCMDADALTKIAWLHPATPRAILRACQARLFVLDNACAHASLESHAAIA